MALIEQFLEAYEHTCDNLEQARLVQIIVDIMGQRPRLNLECPYFKDSYKNEIDILKQKNYGKRMEKVKSYKQTGQSGLHS